MRSTRRERERRVRYQYVGAIADHRNRREIARRVVWQLGVEAGIDGVTGCNNQYRVAIGRRSCHQFRTDDGIRAAAIVDYDILTELLAHAWREQPRHDIVGTSRRVWHHQAHRTARIDLLRVAGR